MIWPWHVFEKQSLDESKPESLQQEKIKLGHGKAVRCAYCKTVITYQANEQAIRGKHVHSFVNPGGFEFTIACYRRAWCKIMGLPMLEWSWFAPHTWQYALCPQCQEHLGWFYHDPAVNSSFYGLIIDRLILEQDENEPD